MAWVADEDKRGPEVGVFEGSARRRRLASAKHPSGQRPQRPAVGEVASDDRHAKDARDLGAIAGLLMSLGPAGMSALNSFLLAGGVNVVAGQGERVFANFAFRTNERLLDPLDMAIDFGTGVTGRFKTSQRRAPQNQPGLS